MLRLILLLNRWFVMHFDVDQKPLTSIGFIASCLTALVFWLVLLVAKFLSPIHTSKVVPSILSSTPWQVAAGGVVAGMISVLFRRVESVLNEQTKRAISVWLKDLLLLRRSQRQEMKVPARTYRKVSHATLTVLFTLFLDQRTAQAVLGDLNERRTAAATKVGSASATRWFWREVVHSFLSLAFAALKRISGVEKLYRRIGL